MAEAEHSRPPGFLRATMREQARLVTIRPMAPPSLLWRVGRWWTRTVLRESSPQLALGALIAIVLLLLLGWTGGAWLVILVLLGLVLVWEARAAWLAHRSTARIEEALEGLEAGGDGPRIPRSHLVIPPLAFVTRGVRRT